MSGKSSSAVEIVEVDTTRVTWRQARDFVAVRTLAFARDPMFQLGWSPNYTFETKPVGGIKLTYYSRLLAVDTFRAWVQLRMVKTRLWMAVKDGQVVGVTRWVLPRGSRAKPTKLHVLKNIFLNFCYKALCLWYFGTLNPAPIGYPQEIHDFFDEFESKIGLKRTDPNDYRRYLAHCTYQELDEMQYLQDDYIWCGFLCVHPQFQHQGIGKLLFEIAKKSIRCYKPTFTDGSAVSSGPVKFGLYATSAGKNIYERAGYREVATHQKIVKGYDISTTFMEMVLDP